jgi:hypothetical protein
MEHVGSSDRMVMLTRRVLLRSVKEYQETGKLPVVLDKPELCRQARGGDVISEVGTDWLDAYEAAKNADRVTPPSVAAE